MRCRRIVELTGEMVPVAKILRFSLFVVAAAGQPTSVHAQDVETGRAEYLAHCASCHGADGKGFEQAGAKDRPADLTLLAKRSGGVFSAYSVYEMIDGRRAIRSHHSSMPIWGCRYASEPVPRTRKKRFRGYQQKPLEEILNLSCDPEEVIRARIQAVVGYLESIQQK
jgi:Cytochrome c